MRWIHTDNELTGRVDGPSTQLVEMSARQTSHPSTWVVETGLYTQADYLETRISFGPNTHIEY